MNNPHPVDETFLKRITKPISKTVIDNGFDSSKKDKYESIAKLIINNTTTVLT
jgi:hypothetical protein